MKYIYKAIFLAAILIAAHKAQGAGLAPSIHNQMRTLKVAVIDTGFTATGTEYVNLCASGHVDFTNTGSISDLHPTKHGTNVAGLISREAGNLPEFYCIVVLKVFDSEGNFNIRGYFQALQYVLDQGFSVLNLSISGINFFRLEYQLLTQILNNGTVVVAAAGNDAEPLVPQRCLIYPACIDSRILVVGNVSPSSNYGPIVDFVIDGRNALAGGVSLTGSSQAAAIVSGRIIKQAYKTATGTKGE